MPRISRLAFSLGGVQTAYDLPDASIPKYDTTTGDMPYGTVPLPADSINYGTHIIFTAPKDGMFYLTMEGSGLFAEAIATVGVLRPGAATSFKVASASLPNDEASSVMLILHKDDQVELNVDNSTHSSSGVKLTAVNASFLGF